MQVISKDTRKITSNESEGFLRSVKSLISDYMFIKDTHLSVIKI